MKQALQAVRHYWHFLDRDARVKGIHARSAEDDELINQCRKVIRLQHKSYRTEKCYLGWVRRFLTDVAPVDRSRISADQVRHFLSYLAVERHVSVSTQNQAFSALLYLSQLMYGCGLRLEECLSLRVMDIDTGSLTLTV